MSARENFDRSEIPLSYVHLKSLIVGPITVQVLGGGDVINMQLP